MKQSYLHGWRYSRAVFFWGGEYFIVLKVFEKDYDGTGYTHRGRVYYKRFEDGKLPPFNDNFAWKPIEEDILARGMKWKNFMSSLLKFNRDMGLE